MSLPSVHAFLAEHALDMHSVELAASTATVALATQAHSVEWLDVTTRAGGGV